MSPIVVNITFLLEETADEVHISKLVPDVDLDVGHVAMLGKDKPTHSRYEEVQAPDLIAFTEDVLSLQMVLLLNLLADPGQELFALVLEEVDGLECLAVLIVLHLDLQFLRQVLKEQTDVLEVLVHLVLERLLY